jgi:lipopolysaccharide transport system ATP-binding protein
MTVVISVEGLGKKFALKHKPKAGSYATFRDAIGEPVRRIGRKLAGRTTPSDPKTGLAEEEFWALSEIGFEVRQGEKIGIIGRNGAGKSTLLKVISRILEPTRGRIRIRGRVASLLEVGTGFHPELTGRENIFFNGAILGMTRAEIKSRFDQIVAFAEVEKFLDTPVKHYSSGMYVRLGFAVAAHLEPEILIVDEVLAVGDAQFQKKCLGKLQEIGREGRTVMFVSHNMSSILQFTDRTILLQSGRILLDGDSETGVMEYLKVNENASKASNLSAKVPWFRVDGLSFDQTQMELGFNKPLKFRLDLTSERELKEVEIIIGIVNSIGARIITAKAGIPVLVPGGRGFSLEIPEHRLVPGTYFVSMIIRTRREQVFSGEQVISIELLEDSVDDPLLMPLIARGKDRWGSYCPMTARPVGPSVADGAESHSGGRGRECR